MKIGNGDSVNVSKDPWIPDLNCSRITTPMIPGMEETKVSSLFKIDKAEWDIDLLRDIFQANDVERILKISVSYSGAEDTWTWLDDEKGAYTVKSGYRRLC